jgi:AcrR family transcriptional regulator
MPTRYRPGIARQANDPPDQAPSRRRSPSGGAGEPAGSAPKKGRRPGDSGTREQIAAAARRQFGAHGYARTTIRSIATEARVDPSLVHHYFGSKQRLFSDVVDLGFNPELLIASIIDAPLQERGARLARFVVDLLKNPHYGAAFTALIHAASSEPQAATLWRERIRHDVFLPLARKLEMDRAEVRAAITATQTLGLVIGCHILKFEALTAMSDDELVALIGPTLQRYLTMPL